MEQFDILAMYYFLVSVRLNEWEAHLETFMKLSAKILSQRLQFTGKYLYNITVYVIPHRNIFVDWYLSHFFFIEIEFQLNF